MEIQLLLAFLCVLPFTTAFHGLPTRERGVYLTALIAAPAGVLVLVWLGTLRRGRPRPHVTLLHAAAHLSVIADDML